MGKREKEHRIEAANGGRREGAKRADGGKHVEENTSSTNPLELIEKGFRFVPW